MNLDINRLSQFLPKADSLTKFNLHTRCGKQQGSLGLKMNTFIHAYSCRTKWKRKKRKYVFAMAVHSEHVFVESRSVIRVILNLIWINLWRMGRQMAYSKMPNKHAVKYWLIQIIYQFYNWLRWKWQLKKVVVEMAQLKLSCLQLNQRQHKFLLD